jgi:hypothetical protein
MTECRAQFSERETRLFNRGGTFFAIEHGRVHLDDLLNVRDGGIVRCHGNPHDVLRVVQIDTGPVGCVAGWISEDE